jgi:hypothetical protein
MKRLRNPNQSKRGKQMSDEEQIRSEKVLAKIREKQAERLDAERQLPLHDEKPSWLRKDLPADKQWTRSERLALSKLADEFLNERKSNAKEE